jgi:hypothetical protein
MAIKPNECDFKPRAVPLPIGKGRRMLPTRMKVTIMGRYIAFDELLLVEQGARQQLSRKH